MKGLRDGSSFGLADGCRDAAAAGTDELVGAQQPPRRSRAQTSAAARRQPEKPAPPDVFSYNPEGRRDPFVSLLFRGGGSKQRGTAVPTGPAGLAHQRNRDARHHPRPQEFVAMVAGPDNKTHIVRRQRQGFRRLR